MAKYTEKQAQEVANQLSVSIHDVRDALGLGVKIGTGDVFSDKNFQETLEILGNSEESSDDQMSACRRCLELCVSFQDLYQVVGSVPSNCLAEREIIRAAVKFLPKEKPRKTAGKKKTAKKSRAKKMMVRRK